MARSPRALDEASVSAILLAGGTLLSAAGGLLLAVPAPVLIAVTLAQLGVAAALWRAPGHPLAVVASVMVVTLGVGLHPELRDQLRIGAMPWVTLAHALATATLLNRSRSPRALAVGVSMLVIAALVVAWASVTAGSPVATSVLAALVPGLGGALAATTQLLSAARHDRVTRARTASVDAPGTAADLQAARRGLLGVILHVETLSGTVGAAAVRTQLAELHAIAARSLTPEPDVATPAVMVQLPASGATDETVPNDRGRKSTPPGEAPELGDRDREIVRLLVGGASNAAIARELYLSEATVKGLVSRLMRRFACDNRTQLAVRASRWSDEDRPVPDARGPDDFRRESRAADGPMV